MPSPVAEVRVLLLSDGTLTATWPEDVLRALGMLEAAKAQILASTHRPAPSVRAVPEGVLRRLPGNGSPS